MAPPRRRGRGVLLALLLLAVLAGGVALLQRDDAGAGARLQQRCAPPVGSACR